MHSGVNTEALATRNNSPPPSVSSPGPSPPPPLSSHRLPGPPGSPLGLHPLAHPLSSHRLPGPPLPPPLALEKVFLTNSELCGRCRLSDFGRVSPRPPPLAHPPASPPQALLPPPFPPTACQAPGVGVAVSAILGGSRLPPLAHPPASPPQALLPSPLSRPSKIQKKGPPLSPFAGVAVSGIFFAGVAVSAILGGSPLGLQPTPPPLAGVLPSQRFWEDLP